VSFPSHVLMTADAVGGVWTYALDLARALAPHGVRVSLATMGPRPSAQQRAEALRIPGLSMHESDYRLEWMDDPWADVDAASHWLLDLEQRLAPDLIHINGFVHGALPWTVPTVVVAHSCVVSWWNAVHECDPPQSWWKYRQRVRSGLVAAGAVFAVSQSMADSVLRHYAVPGVIAVPNARDGGTYRPARKEPFILTSGRAWDLAKNIPIVDAAAAEVDWPVYLAGETEHPDGGTAGVHHLKKLGRLSAEEIRDRFARTSIYALPALYEPFGLSILEAALCGCALVLGDIPSLRENWSDAAVFVNPRDPQQLAAALNDLSSSREHRERLAYRARIRALHFTPERMASSYLAGYLQAQSRGAASCAS
jgi:glycogen(starch) synthase